MSDDFVSNLKPLAECEGRQDKCGAEGCPKFGTLGKPARSDGLRRVRGCKDPVAIGKNSKRKGNVKQRKARVMLGVPNTSSLAPGHEEHFAGTLRVEIKAGAQVKPVYTKYLLAEAQSEAARPFGDHRPFVFMAMPDGVSYGLLVVRTDRLEDVVAALYEQLGLGEAS